MTPGVGRRVERCVAISAASPAAPQPHIGYPGQPPGRAHDLFRVTVTV
jgi:hypothetical protein